MPNDGTEADPKVVNLRQPMLDIVLQTPGGPVHVDMQRFAQAAGAMGLDIHKGDVLSIGAHRNARNEWVPDYGTIQMERRGPGEDECE